MIEDPAALQIGLLCLPAPPCVAAFVLAFDSLPRGDGGRPVLATMLPDGLTPFAFDDPVWEQVCDICGEPFE